MTGCHTNTATAPLSACHEALVKTLPIQADLSWSPLPLVPLWNCCFSLFVLKLLHLAPILPFVSGPSPAVTWPCHNLLACLFLCPSSICVLFLSIALNTHPFLLMLQPLSLKLLFLGLPRGNLGELNTKHLECGDGSKTRIHTILGTQNSCWSLKWTIVQSNCTQIQIVGLFWIWQ